MIDSKTDSTFSVGTPKSCKTVDGRYPGEELVSQNHFLRNSPMILGFGSCFSLRQQVIAFLKWFHHIAYRAV